jgi:hypothetical protein
MLIKVGVYPLNFFIKGGAIMAHYSLTVENQAPSGNFVCVYTTMPGQEQLHNVFSLAWFTSGIESGDHAKFEWDLDYSFAWSKTAALGHGVISKTWSQRPADPAITDRKRVIFRQGDYSYEFRDPISDTNPQAPSGSESLLIHCDETVKFHDASIGLGISGTAAIAIEAQPNNEFVFTAHPAYWVVAGNFIKGQVIDINRMSNPYEVVYNGTTDRKILLTPQNTWKSGDNF